jgi:hypothetical protein
MYLNLVIWLTVLTISNPVSDKRQGISGKSANERLSYHL